MGRRRASAAGSGDAPEFTRTLLTRLGLPPDANREDVDAAHEGLVAFLESAPPALRTWARAQTAAAEAAYVLLVDEEPDDEVREEADDEVREEAGDELDEELDDVLGEDEPARPGPARGGPGRRTLPERAKQVRRSRLLPVALVVIVAAVVYGVYRSGGSGVPAVSAGATPAPSASVQPLDTAKVAALMGKLKANPKDATTLRALGDLYFQAGDYKTAADWHQKILSDNPKDVTALLALGAARFNAGDAADAERQWLKVVALDPKQAEAHYDLGFLYLSKSPPDMAKVRAEWTTVVKIDPGSDIAKTVSTHLQSLNGSSPGSAPGSSASSSPGPAAGGK